MTVDAVHTDHPEARVIVASAHCVQRFRQRMPIREPGALRDRRGAARGAGVGRRQRLAARLGGVRPAGRAVGRDARARIPARPHGHARPLARGDLPVARMTLPAPQLFVALVATLLLVTLTPLRPRLPRGAFALGQGLVGVVLGTYLHTKTLTALGWEWVPVALVGVATLGITTASGLLLARVTGADPVTASLGTVAGGASGIVAMADELGANDRLVAFMQYTRLVVVLLVTPLVVGVFFGVHGGHAPAAGAGFLTPLSGWLLIAVSLAVGMPLARLVRLPAASLLGPLLVASVLTLTGVAGGAEAPSLARDAGFVLIGAQIGLRFTREEVHAAGRMLPAVVASTLLLIAACYGLGLLLVVTTGRLDARRLPRHDPRRPVRGAADRLRQRREHDVRARRADSARVRGRARRPRRHPPPPCPSCLRSSAPRALIAQRALGREIVEVDDADTYVCRPHTPGDIADALVGARLTAARRRGKAMWLETDRGPVLGLHLGMAGKIVVDGREAGDPKPDPNGTSPVWDRFALRFADGGSLVLRDKRRLGRAVLDPSLDRLGPDAAEVSKTQFRERVGRGSGPLKARIMDQSVIAGVGNLLADEALWHARLSPLRPAGALSDEELDELWRAIRAATRSAIRKGGVHTGDVIPARRRGASCPRCGAEMTRAKVGGRTTWWCPVEPDLTTEPCAAAPGSASSWRGACRRGSACAG